MGKGIRRGKGVCVACLFSFDNFLSNNDRLLIYVLVDRWKVMDKVWEMETGLGRQ